MRQQELSAVYNSINQTVKSMRYTCYLKNEKTCGANQYLGTDNNCYCNSRYSLNAEKTACVVSTSCPANSTLKSDNLCYCKSGYVLKNNQCVATPTEDCRQTYGANVYGVVNPSQNNSTCYCETGYSWNAKQTACIKQAQTTICETGQFLGADGKCTCGWRKSWSQIQNMCITYNALCIEQHGPKSRWQSNKKACSCLSGYKLNKANQCVKK